MSDLADFVDWSTADYAAECRRLRHAIRQLADHTNPGRIYIGEWITTQLGHLLNGTDGTD